MAPQCQLVKRSDAGSQNVGSGSSLNVVMVIGIAVACAIVVGGAIWLAVHIWRQRQARKREDRRSSAFVTVRGVVREAPETAPTPRGPQMRQGTGFSRSNLTASVVMPDKTVLPKDATREEIIEYYTAEGSLPRPFAPFAPPPHPGGNARPESTGSFLSVLSGSFRNSAYSSNRASTASSFSVFDEGSKRKVRQLFNPTLPDELVISLGERVTLVQSYDDGWCIVGRDSVFKPGEVDLGAVPAWVFVKPVKGLKAERPIRTTSLGVTVTLDAPGGPREDVISWSNF